MDGDDVANRSMKNTFLSRVFGLNSEDAAVGSYGYSIQNEESVYQLDTAHDAEHVRIPESDQGSSSSDEEHFTIQNSNLSQTHGNRSRRQSNNSLDKVGQMSSDEEIQNTYKADDSVKELEQKDSDFASRNMNLSKSLLFQRLMPNAAPQNPLRSSLFTSTNDTDVTDNNPDMKYNNARATPGTESWTTRAGGFTLPRPTFLNQIHSLNNTPENKVYTLSPKEQALWQWANVENLDLFLQQVYDYYLGNGFSCILLQKLLNIATLLFVVYVSTYAGYCVDYSKLASSHSFHEIMIERCYQTSINGFTKFLLWVFYIFVGLKIIQLYKDFKDLRKMQNFYLHLLNIGDDELQTIPWQNVIQQLMVLKDLNALTANVVEIKAKSRIDAYDVANRIMRRENYCIALYNSGILRLSLPLPFCSESTLTKTLEWNINLCIMGYVLNDTGFVKQIFLMSGQKHYLKEELQKRFMLAGFLNIILAPFLVSYFILLYFFRYFHEYRNSPGTIGARQYTPMAEWTLREYNELYHLFRKRISLSRSLANKYIDQFPKEKTNLVMRFVSFICGSFVAILALITIYDPENFLNFEVTKDKTALFYITILGTLWSISQSMISNEYQVFEPEETIKELSLLTHYSPKSWVGKYHTEDVKQEFCKLYDLRLMILIRELTSLVLTPFILWFSLPQCAGEIVDFFRETTTYVDGLGYVCKYAMVDFNSSKSFAASPNVKKKPDINLRRAGPKGRSQHPHVDIENREEISEDELANDTDESYGAAAQKMMQSYMYFIDDYQNDQSILGKYQLHEDVAFKNNLEMQQQPKNEYSWKKQFKVGQKPELFKVGKHALRFNSNEPFISNFQHGYGKHANPRTNLNTFTRDREVETRFNRPEGGVLDLVRDYYKKSDVGR